MKRFPAPALVSLLVSVLWFAPSVRALDNPMKPAAPATVVHFTKIDRLDLAAILPDPPAAGSLAANADLETVLQVQAARTPEQVAWAQVVERNDLFEAFGAGG